MDEAFIPQYHTFGKACFWFGPWGFGRGWRRWGWSVWSGIRRCVASGAGIARDAGRVWGRWSGLDGV